MTREWNTPSRAQFMLALQRIRGAHTATNQELTELCQHVPEHQQGHAIDLLQHGSAVALPGIAVQGAYWHLAKSHTQFIATAFRTPESFRHPHARHAAHSPHGMTECKFVDDALAYARSTWGPYLREDIFPSAALFRLHELCGSSRPVTKLVYSFLKTPTADLPTASRILSFDDALMLITADRLKGEERCGWYPEVFDYCGHCGHSLTPHRPCEGCEAEFSIASLNPEERSPLAMPPRIIVTFEAQGHHFTRQPRDWLS